MLCTLPETLLLVFLHHGAALTIILSLEFKILPIKNVPRPSLVAQWLTLCFHCRWCGFNPWFPGQGPKILHALQQGQKKTKRMPPYVLHCIDGLSVIEPALFPTFYCNRLLLFHYFHCNGITSITSKS